MTNARDIAERYLSTFYCGDGLTARQYLADDLSLSGPAATFSNADNYMRASEHARRTVRGMQVHKVFVDGPDVGIFHDLLVDHPAGSIPIAEWYHLHGDKIASIRTVFDTAPFAAGAGERSGETALDPVCRMAVQKAAAAAMPSYRGGTYYFCSPGCAEAFEQDPRTYLTSAQGNGAHA